MMKRIIKLFRTPNNCYLLNSNGDRIIRISNETYERLANIKNTKRSIIIVEIPQTITNFLGTFRPQWDFSQQRVIDYHS